MVWYLEIVKLDVNLYNLTEILYYWHEIVLVNKYDIHKLISWIN